MAEYRIDPGVEEELWLIWRHIAQDNPDAATRVVEAAFETFAALTGHPRLGRARKFKDPRLRGMRSIGVRGFPNYLIFYRVIREVVHIHHVYHGARDIDALFDE